MLIGKQIRILNALLVMVLLGTELRAQTPSDASMMEARQACVLLDYTYGSFDQYWEGDLLRENETIATVRRNVLLPMVAVGILDKLDVYVGLPFIKTESSEPNGGKFEGAAGLQDLITAVKYEFFKKDTKGGTISVLGTVGFSIPVSNYLPDYMPYSIGLGAPELSYRAISQYKWNNGLYVRGAVAYLWRGYCKAEREYYYNNGSYYTPWMDVPSAVTAEGVVGVWLLDNSLQLELNYFGSKSTSGDDIRPYNAAQPTNNVDIDALGLQARYFPASIKGFGVVARHNRVLNGRNAAKISNTGVGVTYLFYYLNKKD